MRGDELRQHLLWQAKTVFLETGFAGASMDAIAKRAGTTKRTLYAHFENKESLFLAVVDLVRDLLDAKLGSPGDLADDPVEALALFCDRVRCSVLWAPTIRTCRLGISEAARFPKGATGFYHALFGSTIERMTCHVHARFGLPIVTARALAGELAGLTLEPWFTRALFGVDDVPEDWPEQPTTAHPQTIDQVRRSLQAHDALPAGQH